jgi:uncharacterized protein YjbI with pentapeptide repeats
MCAKLGKKTALRSARGRITSRVMIKGSSAVGLVVHLFAMLWAVSPAVALDCTTTGKGVNWQRCYVDERNLAGETLAGANLREASFQRSNLDGADLTGANAYRARFLSASLKGAKLDRGQFSEADFTRADLTGASLRNVDLRRARFYHASLRGADLSGAKAADTDFLNADLSGALWTDGKRTCAAGSVGQCR